MSNESPGSNDESPKDPQEGINSEYLRALDREIADIVEERSGTTWKDFGRLRLLETNEQYWARLVRLQKALKNAGKNGIYRIIIVMSHDGSKRESFNLRKRRTSADLMNLPPPNYPVIPNPFTYSETHTKSLLREMDAADESLEGKKIIAQYTEVQRETAGAFIKRIKGNLTKRLLDQIDVADRSSEGERNVIQSTSILKEKIGDFLKRLKGN